MPGGATYQGLSLYRATGGLLRSTRHAVIGDLPAERPEAGPVIISASAETEQQAVGGDSG